jgi:hypothetical protein
MKAYKLRYDTAGRGGVSTVVLVEEGQTVEEALAEKDGYFEIDCRYSVVYDKREIPLSNILVSGLSVTELLKVLKLRDGE